MYEQLGSDYRAWASNPAGLTLNRKRFSALRRKAAGVVGALLERPDRRFLTHCDTCLSYGDARAALVLSETPLRIAAYSDVFDAVVLQDFPPSCAARYDLRKGKRLIAVNAYTDVGPQGEGLTKGPKAIRDATGRWTDVVPLIGDLFSDDVRRLDHLRAGLSEQEWQRCQTLAAAHPDRDAPSVREGIPNPVFDPLPTSLLPQDDDSRASNPGATRLQPMVWLISPPYRPLLYALGCLLAGALILFFQQIWLTAAGLVAAGLAAFRLAALYRDDQRRFYSGCINPAMVVHCDPPLIAVHTDLAKYGQDYPVLKLVRVNRAAIGPGPLTVGRRVTTVSLYYRTANHTPYWYNFDPIPLRWASRRERDQQRAFAHISDAAWQELEQGYADAGRPTTPGLYLLKGDWPSALQLTRHDHGVAALE